MSHAPGRSRAGGPAVEGGAMLDEAVALQAAEWFFRLQSGEATEADRLHCARWCAEHPSHAQAWDRAQRVGQTLAQLPPTLAMPVLARARRRTAVRTLALLLVAAPPAWLAWRHTPAREWLADQRTVTGEGRALVLADGTRLQLDTASAVDIAWDGDQRLLRLRAGAIHLQTAPDVQVPPRPLRVATAQGVVQALGTRFTVRQETDHTRIAVFEGAVQARPARGPAALVLQAGQQARMGLESVGPPGPVRPQDDSWTCGVLHVRDMPLPEFLAELGRYRVGLLRCDPAVGGLRVSGVFQLRDTAAVIDSLPQFLPVAVAYRTRYWVVVTAPDA